MSETQPMTVWRRLWLIWLGLFLLTEVPAALWTWRANGTLSVTVWSVWFTGWTVWLLVAFLAVLAAHFADRGRHWWSSGRAVLLASLPVVAVILSREVEVGKVFGWLKAAGGKVWGFTKSRGPLISSAIMGLSFVFPALKVLVPVVGAVLPGSAPADGELGKAIGELAVGLVALLGTIRKVIALYQKSQPR